jgi:hypothetical protein
MGMKQKKIQNGRLKKTEFFNSANSQYFFSKISWIGSWVKPHPFTHPSHIND